MSELGYKGFETLAEVIEDWDKKGTLEKLIAQYRIPLISAYATLERHQSRRSKGRNRAGSSAGARS